ncbi:MAG TPA: glycosyltransferase N-terminal domain-containing protein [Candidatus Paceibacterota bacterium]|nr:glycosyltransferase N-terminal domain-containing protein [Candidatus Paceibacterota bacterium]
MIDLDATNALLTKTLTALRAVAARHGDLLKTELGATDEKDQRVVDELFEEELDRRLREDDEFHRISDELMDEIELRFSLLTDGTVRRNKQGWPQSWSWETDDRATFIKTVTRFSSNHAPRFGRLLTPLVNGVRVSGEFLPAWNGGQQPKLVLLDGEGLGHTPKSVAAISTSLTRRIESTDAIVLVEAEIWPNFLWKARARRTPVFLVNARLSKRSYRGYRLVRPLFRPLFATLAGVGAQTDEDAARLVRLGCRPETVRVVGSLKFDAAKLEERRLFDAAALLRQIGVPDNAPILIAGSTHAGEEALLADILPRLRARHPDLFLVLVPRHFERGREVGRELEARGIKFIYRREVTASTQLPERSLECLLVNTTGELKDFYETATVIFVGKSLTAQGGQNPVEPGALGKAMVFGPNMQNFAAIAESFVKNGGARQVRDAAELEQTLGQLLSDPAARAEMGRNAVAVVKANTGAIGKTIDMIVQSLAEEENLVTRP